MLNVIVVCNLWRSHNSEGIFTVKRLLCASLCLLLLSACAQQQTMFLSEPLGARVTIDGQFVGTTPVAYDYTLGSGDQHKVTIEKDGFAPLEMTVTADETSSKDQAKWMAAGLVWSPLFLGTLFTKGMNDSFMMVLKRSERQVADNQIQPTPLF